MKAAVTSTLFVAGMEIWEEEAGREYQHQVPQQVKVKSGH
jgi:hypothetical protein